MHQDSLFKKYGVSLLYYGLPHNKVVINDSILINQIKATKSFFGRYYTDSQLSPPPPIDGLSVDGQSYSDKSDTRGWWHCVKTEPIYIDKLTSKQRYRINKGLRLNAIYIADIAELNSLFPEIVDLIQDSYSDYPSFYRPNYNIEDYVRSLINASQNENCDLWLVKDIASDKLVGLSYCVRVDDVINLLVVKVRPSYLKNEINAALGYQIVHYYMNDLGLRYICDGERNIRHITNYQDFLVRVLGFKKVYCKLHVVYHPMLKPIIKIIYPFRRLIFRIGKINRHIYDVACLLRQEEIVRKQ